ncbi:hypothetical protein [Petrachloros mirabilis]
MKFVLLTISLLLSLVDSQILALAAESPHLESTDQPWSFQYPDNAAAGPVSNVSQPHPIFETHLRSTTSAAPAAAQRLRDLVPETEYRRSNGLLANTTWFNGAFSTDAEIATAQGGKSWLAATIPGDTRYHDSDRMVRFGLTRKDDGFSYGIRYRHAGQAYLQTPDQEDRELWGEWREGWINVKSSIGNRLNNVDGDPTKPRLERTYGQIGLALARPSWPELKLRYANEFSRNTQVTADQAVQQTRSHIFESSLAYQRLHWNIRLSSSYTVNRDLLQGEVNRTVRNQLLAGVFRPLEDFTVMPTLGYRQETDDWSGLRINSPSASLTLQYKKNRRLYISASGNYGNSRSSDGLIDYEKIGGRGSLSWNLRPSAAWKARVAVEAGYNRLVNRITPASGTEDIIGLVRLVLATL